MSDFDNTNRGALFNNRDKKREGKSDPDYKGRINVNGVDAWLSAWINKSKDGVTYMSLSATPMEQQAAPKKEEPAADFEPDTQIPF